MQKKNLIYANKMLISLNSTCWMSLWNESKRNYSLEIIDPFEELKVPWTRSDGAKHKLRENGKVNQIYIDRAATGRIINKTKKRPITKFHSLC